MAVETCENFHHGQRVSVCLFLPAPPRHIRLDVDVDRVVLFEEISQGFARHGPRQIPDKHHHTLRRIKMRAVLANVQLAVVQLLSIQDLDRTRGHFRGAVAY